MKAIVRLNWLRKLALLVVGLFCWVGLQAGSPAWALDPSSQLQQLETQVETLQTLLDQQDWLEIRSYIHGPMGLVRKDLAAIIQDLSPAQRQQGVTLSRKLTSSLEKIDLAAESFNQPKLRTAQKVLQETMADLEVLVSNG